MRMKWSNENFMRQCEIADKKLEYERELTIIDEYAINLRDCRDMYSRLENYGKTQFCLGCERHARRVAELEAQLAEAKKDGDRLDFLIGRFQEVSHRVVDALGISADEHFKDVGDGEMEIDWRAAIAAAAAEGEKK